MDGECMHLKYIENYSNCCQYYIIIIIIVCNGD